jgi:hypothetical protein
MEGENRITLLGAPDDGGAWVLNTQACCNLLSTAEYMVTMPNMYARGILFGKMVLELGDTCVVKNEKNRLFCDLEFKTKVATMFARWLSSSNATLGLLRRNIQRDSRTCTQRKF